MGAERMGGEGAILTLELERAKSAGASACGVILVEGASDQRAIAALARRQRRDLQGERVEIIATAGATNVGRFVDILGPGGHGVALAGLYDQAERADFASALKSVGLVSEQIDMEHAGFHMCVRDLEDELIRALGAEAMVELIASQGHLRRFHSFQNQPAQRHKTIEQQLWRWLGNHKIRYAPLMVERLEMHRAPRPLLAVLSHV